ncbi:hypothetical protein D3C80_1801760 [compost metagenome]
MEVFSIFPARKRHNSNENRDVQMSCSLFDSDDKLSIIYRLRHYIIRSGSDFLFQTFNSFVQMLHIRIKCSTNNKISLLLKRLA